MNAAERLQVLARQRQVLHDLVEALLDKPEDRLDVTYLHDWRAAQDDGAALRAVVDQVASMTDLRATALHAMWV